MLVRDADAFSRVRQQVEESSENFWGPVAQQELHWFVSDVSAWLSSGSAAGSLSVGSQRKSGAGWSGWHAFSAEPELLTRYSLPWEKVMDVDGNFVRWFHGGQTNAAFNEVDRHVLQGIDPVYQLAAHRHGTPRSLLARRRHIRAVRMRESAWRQCIPAARHSRGTSRLTAKRGLSRCGALRRVAARCGALRAPGERLAARVGTKV